MLSDIQSRKFFLSGDTDTNGLFEYIPDKKRRKKNEAPDRNNPEQLYSEKTESPTVKKSVNGRKRRHALFSE